MGTCSTCKWWIEGYLPHMLAQKPQNVCDLASVGSMTSRTSLEILSYADDDSGLMTELATGPDFGCIHHTIKETK